MLDSVWSAKKVMPLHWISISPPSDFDFPNSVNSIDIEMIYPIMICVDDGNFWGKHLFYSCMCCAFVIFHCRIEMIPSKSKKFSCFVLLICKCVIIAFCCIFYSYLDNKVFVSLSNGDLMVYRRDLGKVWFQ